MVLGVEVWDGEEDVFDEPLGGGRVRRRRRVEVVVGPGGER